MPLVPVDMDEVRIQRMPDEKREVFEEFVDGLRDQGIPRTFTEDNVSISLVSMAHAGAMAQPNALRLHRGRRHDTSIYRRQWSLGPHCSGSLRARTQTEPARSRDVKT